MSLINVTGLTSIKRDRILFENLDFVLSKGELVHLKGANGAGKTSLMRIIAGLADPTEGKVSICEEEINASRDILTSALIYIGHKSGCNALLNALENTQFWANQQGLSISNERIEEVLFELGLAGLEDLPVSQLSAGQQRRVALARLWLKPHAQLWLLDEPFTALDIDGIALIESRLQSHIKNGGGALITSHQPLKPQPYKRDWTLEYRF